MTKPPVAPPVLPDRQVVCVLGMHRSGTSIIARLTNILGVSLGPDSQLMQPAFDNPKGYWEHLPFMYLNDALLGRFGLDWKSIAELPAGWEQDPTLDDLRSEARTLLQAFADEAVWGWKDPRSCLTLPFWQAHLPPMRYVLCLRNVIDVARSLERRDGIPIEDGARLWLHYTIAALENTAGRPTLCVFYEDVIDDPQGQAARLSEFLFSDSSRATAHASAITEALDAELHHHQSTPADVAQEGTVDEAAKSLFMILRAAVPQPCASGRPPFLSTVAALAREESRRRESIAAIHALRAANEEQSRELAARTQALDALRQELAARTQEVETLAAEIQALTARGREQQDSLAALRVHAQAMAGAYRDAVASSQALSAELDAILASRAWRWVTEYRKLRGLIDRRQPRTHRRSSTRSA